MTARIALAGQPRPGARERHVLAYPQRLGGRDPRTAKDRKDDWNQIDARQVVGMKYVCIKSMQFKVKMELNQADGPALG